MTEQNKSGAGAQQAPWWPIVAVLGATLVVFLGIAAWNAGHDVAFAVLVLAGAVVLGCERIVVAIKSARPKSD